MTTMKNKLENSILVLEAQRWLGVQEKGGNNQGQIINMFQKTIGKAVGEPWCMSFCQYCLFMSDHVLKILRGRNHTNHLISKSEHCLTVWNNSHVVSRIKEPLPGSIVIWNFKGTTNGHCGIVEEVHRNHLITIEGNTSDNVRRVVREGDGVYRKKRYRYLESDMQILGYLDPWL